MSGDLFDYAASKEERDKALKKVTENGMPFSELAMVAMRSFPDPTATGEDVRRHVTRMVGEPHHHNAWGAVIMMGVRRGVLAPTGEYRAMTSKKSHARKTPVYEVRRG